MCAVPYRAKKMEIFRLMYSRALAQAGHVLRLLNKFESITTIFVEGIRSIDFF